MDGPLARKLPKAGASDDEILQAFLSYVEERDLVLYPAQEEAILELYAGNNVILATPTGSGKTLVALAMVFRALAKKEAAYYTTPIKALANEKFFDLARELSPDDVGMATGDASIHRDALITCCTAEVLANMALAEGPNANVKAVVMDEFHYFADRERGVAWQVPLLTLPHAQFLLMSATLGPTDKFESGISNLTGKKTVTVRGMHRPVPLEFSYKEIPLHETLTELADKGKTPVYLVNFTQRSAFESAQALTSVDLTEKETKKEISKILSTFRFDTPFGKDLKRLLLHGIGVHHAGLLPKYRLLVEKLAQDGLLRVVSGTDTLGVGVNIPIRTVLFTKLCKYDGERTAVLTARDFHQIAGRAGRRGFDDRGYVLAQAPEHVIENLRIDAKIEADPSKKKKLVKKKPPDFGYVAWDAKVFERLTTAIPEPLVSRFRVSHSMVYSVLTRTFDGGCAVLGRLIRSSYEPEKSRRFWRKQAWEMYDSLVRSGVLIAERRAGTRRVIRASQTTNENLSLDQPLALFVLSLLPKLAAESETYALDVLSLIESVVENPNALLDRIRDKAKEEAMIRMKADGVPYEERIAELENVDYPKPLASFLWDSFSAFTLEHPWAKTENVRPKGIARDMIEEFDSFNDFVRRFGMSRSEGLLLRYLSDVYKVLSQTIPQEAKTEELFEIEETLETIVRHTDASLLEEWERLRTGERLLRPAEVLTKEPDSITSNKKAFRILLRNALFAIVRAAAAGDVSLAEEYLVGTWTKESFIQFFAPYFTEHPMLYTDPSARKSEWLVLTEEGDTWHGSQSLVDGEDNDFAFQFRVSLAVSDEAGTPKIELTGLRR